MATHRFDTPGSLAIRIRTGSGQITVEATDTQETEVTLEPLRDDELTREVIASARVELVERAGGHELVVELAKKAGFTLDFGGLQFGRGPKVAVGIRCPRGADVEVASSSADLDASGRLGAFSVKTASGYTLVDEVASLSATSVSGEIQARQVAGRAQVNTASGDVRIERALGAVAVNTVSGDVTVHDARGPVTIQTLSGDQSVDGICTGEAKLNSVSGDVRAGVRPGVKLWIDANSVSGDLRSELGVNESASAAGSDPVVPLRVKTLSGDVSILRSSALDPIEAGA